MNKRDEYNLVLDKLFTGTFERPYFTRRKPTPGMYNRVRFMCKTYTAECMSKAVDLLEEIYNSDWFVIPKTPTEGLNYLQGIAKKLYNSDQELEINRNPAGLKKLIGFTEDKEWSSPSSTNSG